MGDITRRDILTGAVAGAAALVASRSVAGLQGGRAASLAYVGSYTPNGLGIYLFRVDADGALTQIKVVTTPNPSWLSSNPAKTHLYAASESAHFNDTTTGAVSAFSINRATGDLTFLNTVSSQGSGPAHLSVDPSGKFVLVSNYAGGNCAVIPVLADGSLGA